MGLRISVKLKRIYKQNEHDFYGHPAVYAFFISNN